MSRAALAMTGAAPVPVPPPMPAAMKHMCAPSSRLARSSIVSSAAARPISGRAPAPRPCVILAPSWMRVGAVDCFSDCASVFATRKSTPCTSAFIMLAMALPPAPPTPITAMRGVSSSTSGARNSMLIRCNSAPERHRRSDLINLFAPSIPVIPAEKRIAALIVRARRLDQLADQARALGPMHRLHRRHRPQVDRIGRGIEGETR